MSTADEPPDQAPSPATAEPAAEPPPRRPRSATPLVAALAVVLALAALAGVAAVGWAWYGMRGEQSRVAELEGRVAGLEGRLAALQNSAARTGAVQALDQRLKDLSQAQTAQNQAFGKALQNLEARLAAGGLAYREDEAAALMRLAEARLQLASDPVGAGHALRIADATLTALDDPGLAPVRAALAREIAALAAVPVPDLAGAQAGLAALAGRIDRLPLAGDRLALPPRAASAAGGWSWSGVAAAFKRAFGPLVVVRHGARARPLLPPREAYFVRENVKLALRAAGLALLERDAAGYRANLDRARQWITAWFDTSAPGVTATLAALDRLQSLELAPPLPRLGAALAALEAARAGSGNP